MGDGRRLASRKLLSAFSPAKLRVLIVTVRQLGIIGAVNLLVMYLRRSVLYSSGSVLRLVFLNLVSRQDRELTTHSQQVQVKPKAFGVPVLAVADCQVFFSFSIRLKSAVILLRWVIIHPTLLTFCFCSFPDGQNPDLKLGKIFASVRSGSGHSMLCVDVPKWSSFLGSQPHMILLFFAGRRWRSRVVWLLLALTSVFLKTQQRWAGR